MKFLQIFIIGALSYILAIACSAKPEITPPYNTRCNYVIYGKILGIDSVLLENISVKMYEVTTDLPPRTVLRDSCISYINGLYEVKNRNVIPYISNTYELHFKDLNKFYNDTAIVVIFTNEKFPTDREGFVGEASWELNISLTKN